MDAGDSNQRVTNVVLKKDIDHLTGAFREFREEVRDCNKEFRGRITTLEREQDKVKTRLSLWSGLNSLGVIGASILSSLGINK